MMQMGRCKQRFQRAIFLGWLLPAVGVVNVNIAVSEILKRIWGPAHLTKLQGARGVHVLGFDKWFQQHLGEFVMRRGVEMATKAAQANGRTQPHFMPSKGRLHWELPLILPAPDRSIEDHGEPINVYKNRRAIIVARDGGGKATAWLGGGDKQATSRGWECELCKRRCIAKGLSRKRAKEAGELRRTQWACKLCKHFLCKRAPAGIHGMTIACVRRLHSPPPPPRPDGLPPLSQHPHRQVPTLQRPSLPARELHGCRQGVLRTRRRPRESARRRSSSCAVVGLLSSGRSMHATATQLRVLLRLHQPQLRLQMPKLPRRKRRLRKQPGSSAAASLHSVSAVARMGLMSASRPDRSQRVAGRTV